MGGLHSQYLMFPINADSVCPLGVAWSSGALGAVGQEHLLLLETQHSMFIPAGREHYSSSSSFPALVWISWFTLLAMES